MGKTIIQQIWDSFLTLWSQRKSIIHGANENTRQDNKRKQFIGRVERCYQFKDQLQLSDRNKIFYKTQEEMLLEDPREIQTWLRLSERIIRVHRKEIKQRTKESIMMEQYVKWNPPTRRKARTKPRKTTPHQKQDLKPD